MVFTLFYEKTYKDKPSVMSQISVYQK